MNLSASPGSASVPSLRQSAIRGGTYLALRHSVGVGFAVVGQPLLARIIGPPAYGLWIAAVQLSTCVRSLSAWGIDVYLIRKEGELPRITCDQAFAMLGSLGLIGTGLTLTALSLIERWTRLHGLPPVLAAITGAMPLTLIALVPAAKLERALDYRALGTIELVGRGIFYVTALVLAARGSGVWGLVAAVWLEQVFSVTMLHVAAGYRPRFHREPALAREMVRYGLGFSASVWLYQLRGLVNPLIVGRYVGAAAVGYIGLAERLVAVAGFAKDATWRLSMAVLAKVQDDKMRLGRAVSEGSRLQVLAVAATLLMLGFVLPRLLTHFFGEKWAAVAQVYPFIASGAVANSVFNIHASVLYVLRRNKNVSIFHGTYIILFGTAAFLLVRSTGWLGYGWAELIAIPSYALLHAYTAAQIEGLDYRFTIPLALAAGSAFFWPYLGVPALSGLLILGLYPATWKLLHRYASEWRQITSDHGIEGR
jgi:O-antigen/teichoic acid export membrane protein